MSQVSQKSFGRNNRTAQKNKASKRYRARTWSFTYNNPDENLLSQFLSGEIFLQYPCKKYLVQEEIGESCGTPHLQGCVTFKNQLSFKTVVSLIPGGHWENSRNLSAAFKYCGKIDTRKPDGHIFEYGDVNKYIERTPEDKDKIISDFIQEVTGQRPFIPKIVWGWDDQMLVNESEKNYT